MPNQYKVVTTNYAHTYKRIDENKEGESPVQSDVNGKPRSDVIGCADKYARSVRPLVFSTELARSNNVKIDEVKYGMINLRCEGKEIIMAQIKEATKAGQVWDSYEKFVDA